MLASTYLEQVYEEKRHIPTLLFLHGKNGAPNRIIPLKLDKKVAINLYQSNELGICWLRAVREHKHYCKIDGCTKYGEIVRAAMEINTSF
ncbi:MAG: hypothetical protein KIB10_06650 [Enterococcus avium]|nr:hypothetical protein [Enterococcus avium]